MKTFHPILFIFNVSERSRMIFNILQQLENVCSRCLAFFFNFTTQAGKLSRFLSCHGVSLNLIEISPFHLSSFLSNLLLLYNDFYTQKQTTQQNRHINSRMPLAKLKKRKRETFLRHRWQWNNPSNLSTRTPTEFPQHKTFLCSPADVFFFFLFMYREKPFRCKMYHLLSLLDDFNKSEKRKEFHISDRILFWLAICKNV